MRRFLILLIVSLLIAGCAASGQQSVGQQTVRPTQAGADTQAVKKGVQPPAAAAGPKVVFKKPLVADIEFVYPARAGGESIDMLLLMKERPEKALKHFSTRVLKYPKDWENYYNLGLLYSKLNFPEEAEEVLKKSLKQGAPQSKVYNALGSLYFTTGRKIKAAESYKRSAMFGKSPAGIMNYANSLILIGRVKDARKYYKKLASFTLNDPVYDYNTALYYFHTGEYEKGLESIDRAIEGGRKDVKAYSAKAELLLGLKKYELAIKVYKELLIKSPEDPTAYRNMGIINEVYLGDYKEARLNYSAYVSMGGRDAKVVAGWLSIVKAKMGNRAGEDK